MKCFGMMAEKDCKLHLVLAVAVMGTSHALTVYIVCTTATNAWLSATSLRPSTGLRYHECTTSLLIQTSHLKPLQHWTCSFYEDTSLQKQGLVIQLGHRSPSCPCPGPIQKDFVVADLSGIHVVDVQFCACADAAGTTLSHHIQLLRFCCFPSTTTWPKSAFTFDVLNTFHLLTLQGKVTAYDFYSALQHKTDNTGISDVKVMGFIVQEPYN